MRIILKPLGALTLIVSIGALVAVAIRNKATFTGTSPGVTLPQSYPTNLLGEDSDAAWKLSLMPQSAREATHRFVAAGTGEGGTHSLDIVSASSEAWSVGLSHTIPVALNAGDTLRVRFRARSPGRGTVQVIVSQNAEPWERMVQGDFTPGTQWERYEYSGKAATYAGGESVVAFHVGKMSGHLEIADVRLETTGEFSNSATADRKNP